MKAFKKYWDIFSVILIFAIINLVILILMLKQNHGVFTYNNDDIYIHMAIAKNFAKYGIWGVTKYGFSSASSSLLYTLLLSFFFKIFGPIVIIPYIINIFTALSIILLLYLLLKKQFQFSNIIISICLLCIMLFSSLIIEIYVGMEHNLQTLIAICFSYYASKILSGNESNRDYDKIRNVNSEKNNDMKKGILSNLKEKNNLILLLLAPLVISIRYEGVFLVGIVSLLLLLRKHYLYAIVLMILGFLPISIFGLISMKMGWPFFPTPINLGFSMFNFSSLENIEYSLGYKAIKNLMVNPHLLILLITSSGLFFYYTFIKKDTWNQVSILCIIHIGATILQLQYARTGLLSRYDTYLVGLGIFVIIVSLKDILPRKDYLLIFKRHIIRVYKNISLETLLKELSLIALILFISLPFLYRGVVPLTTEVQASTNVYEQQYQMALFLEEYYQGEVVAANDIGVINFYADIKCLDIWGLSNLEVFNARQANMYTNLTIQEIAQKAGCKIAVVYTPWYDKFGGLPNSWQNVGEWTIKNNIRLGGNTVSFYAVDPAETNNLIHNLQDFSPRLPSTVIQSGNYTL